MCRQTQDGRSHSSGDTCDPPRTSHNKGSADGAHHLLSYNSRGGLIRSDNKAYQTILWVGFTLPCPSGFLPGLPITWCSWVTLSHLCSRRLAFLSIVSCDLAIRSFRFIVSGLFLFFFLKVSFVQCTALQLIMASAHKVK